MRLDSVDVTEPIGAEARHTLSGGSGARNASAGSRFGRRPGANIIFFGAVAFIAVAVRVWALGRNTLTFDESYTAMASRRSMDSLLVFLRYHDAHPPLDYLLRKPLADAGVTNGWFRAPSVVCSVAAFVVFAAWMRRKGIIGLTAIVFMAVAPFELVFGREARPYAAVILVGVVCAAAADRWLRHPDRVALIVVSSALLVGFFEYSAMAFLALGLFTLPMIRRDAEAWKWRAAVTAPVIIWAATWGPSVIDQWRSVPAGWIPYTTPGSIPDVVTGLVTFTAGVGLLVTAAVLLGGIVLWHNDRRLARVAIACFGIPLVLAAGVGLVSHSFLPRELAFGAWVPLVALAAVVDQAARRLPVLGIVLALIVVEVMASPAISAVVSPTEEYGAIQRVDRLARTGDAVAITPSWLAPVIDWNLGVHGPEGRRELSTRFLRARDASAFVPGAARWDGRVWLVERISYYNDVSGVPRCAPDWHDRDYRVFCLKPGGHR